LYGLFTAPVGGDSVGFLNGSSLKNRMMGLPAGERVSKLSRFDTVNGKWLPDFIERLKASAWHHLYLQLLPFTHARSESINADSLKLQLLTARRSGSGLLKQ